MNSDMQAKTPNSLFGNFCQDHCKQAQQKSFKSLKGYHAVMICDGQTN